jgi:hypothetical protein
MKDKRHAWEDIIKLNLKEIVCEAVDCIQLAQDRNQFRAVVKNVMFFAFHKRRKIF